MSTQCLDILNKNHISIIKQIGDGSYGQVFIFKNSKDDKKYAIKRNLSALDTDFCLTIRDLDIMHRINHPYVISLKGIVIDYPYPDAQRNIPDDSQVDPISFVMELGAYDGDTIVKRKNNDYHYMRKMMVDILLGVEYLHNKKIIHRDIKPGNFIRCRINDDLYIDNRALKISDFGLSEPYTSQVNQVQGVSTLFFRAPEIYMEDLNYGFKTDVWSLGCSLFEMVCGHSIITTKYRSYSDLEKHGLNEIKKRLPFFSKKEDGRILEHVERIKIMDKNINLPKYVKIQFPDYNLFLDLLVHMLAYSPEDRYDIHQVLNHPYFYESRDHIDKIRKIYPGNPDPVPNLHIINNEYRKEVWFEIIDIYNNRRKLRWYSHRILFHAIELFDRLLVSNKIKNDTHRNHIINFYLCLYLSIKYFTILFVIPPIMYVIPKKFNITQEEFNNMKHMEIFLICNVFKFEIYRPTLFEISDQFNHLLDSVEICKLFTFLKDADGDLGQLTDIFRSIFKS